MSRISNLLGRWNAFSLARQFLLAGGLVSLAALLLIGNVVTSLIETAITRNAAASAALYVDGVIAPLLPDMRRDTALSDSVVRALDETLGYGRLGERLKSFRLWRRDGTIVYSNDKSLQGRRLEPGEDLKAAFAGQIVAEFNQLEDDPESESERLSALPLLEIYNPLLQPWSGEVVAVSEFYEVAADVERSLQQARLWSWIAVAGVILCFFLALSAIVLRGSRTIDSQRQALRERVAELSDLLASNKSLQQRIRRASQRTTELNESHLRRIGADLHDGPAQLIALAALRLDSSVVAESGGSTEHRQTAIETIKSSLDEAMREIRSICNGLVLPDIEAAELPDILLRVVKAHEQRTATSVALELSGQPCRLPSSAKICIYRFVQEALNNSFRHGGGVGQSVRQGMADSIIEIEVADRGPGFDPAGVAPTSLGLAGLRERVESLGGQFFLATSDRGTRLRMTLKLNELEQI